jgi:hypothetical protein
MQFLPGATAAAGYVRRAARPAFSGLLSVLAGADPAPAWRSAWRRRAAYAGLGAATLLLWAINLVNLVVAGGVFSSPFASTQVARGSMGNFSALHLDWVVRGEPVVLAVLIALAVVVPLTLAVRYPLLGWRLEWLGLLLVPKAAQLGRGVWPWDPVQILVLLAVFCAAGIRHQRPVLWWM